MILQRRGEGIHTGVVGVKYRGPLKMLSGIRKFINVHFYGIE